jgi:multiple sugar transport system ATP-binding protein
MRADIAALQSRLGTTTVYVTHDQSEAMTLGHRVALLRDGYLQQFDEPRRLYERPANTFVAGFVGSPAMNLLTVPLGTNGSVSLGGVDVPLPDTARQAANAGGWQEVVIGLRPEALELAGDGIPAEVEVVEEIGADAHVFCIADVAGERVKLAARTEARDAPARGERVQLRPKPGHAHVFDARSGECCS